MVIEPIGQLNRHVIGRAFARLLTLMRPAENLARDMTLTFKPFTVLQHVYILHN